MCGMKLLIHSANGKFPVKYASNAAFGVSSADNMIHIVKDASISLTKGGDSHFIIDIISLTRRSAN